jgi:hypothetical protein
MSHANKWLLGSRCSSDGGIARSSSLFPNSQYVVSPTRITLIPSTSGFPNNSIGDLSQSQIGSTSAVVSPGGGARKYGPDDFDFLQDDMFKDDEE